MGHVTEARATPRFTTILQKMMFGLGLGSQSVALQKPRSNVERVLIVPRGRSNWLCLSSARAFYVAVLIARLGVLSGCRRHTAHDRELALMGAWFGVGRLAAHCRPLRSHSPFERWTRQTQTRWRQRRRTPGNAHCIQHSSDALHSFHVVGVGRELAHRCFILFFYWCLFLKT